MYTLLSCVIFGQLLFSVWFDVNVPMNSIKEPWPTSSAPNAGQQSYASKSTRMHVEQVSGLKALRVFWTKSQPPATWYFQWLLEHVEGFLSYFVFGGESFFLPKFNCSCPSLSQVTCLCSWASVKARPICGKAELALASDLVGSWWVPWKVDSFVLEQK